MRFDPLNLGAIALAALLVVAGGPWLMRQLKTLPGAHALAERGGHRIVTLEVGGMTCEVCEAAVRGQLASVPGVEAVDVRHAAGRAYVVCDPSVADTSLTAAVRRAGGGFVASVAQP